MSKKLETRSSSSSFVILGISLIALLVVLGSTTSLLVSASSSSSSSSSSTRDDEEETTTTCATNSNTGTSTGETSTSSFAHPQEDTLIFHHLVSTISTQDETKRIVEAFDKTANIIKTVCVTATEQTNGRGTSGRQWMGARGNTFVTIAIPQSTWMMDLKGIPLTLLPLKIGSLVAHRIQALLTDCHTTSTLPSATNVSVKWPNDVLVNEKKMSGVLIESSSNGWFLIGIGVNVAYAPSVPTVGENHGRPSTCLHDHCSASSTTVDFETAAKQLGMDLAYDLHKWIQQQQQHQQESDRSHAAKILLDDWKQWVDWDMELTMRDTPQRERVRLVDLLPDGRVEVVGIEDGVKRTLVSDYFL
jgi:biotin-(acetyl-CoA carboxylase) ligase